MDKRWIGLALVSLFCWGSLPPASEPADGPRPEVLTIESLARTYTTPKALARFLQQAITFKTDEELFGEADYWQTPEEFLARRAGDCEDYALFVQKVLQRQGIEAHVLSLFGEDGYAHTVCVFRDSGRYQVFNQDRLRTYRANTLDELAWRLYQGWTYGALSRHTGTRGEAIHLIHNPNPLSASWRSDPLFSFP